MRRTDDFLEELLRRAAQREPQQGHQDDIVIQSVRLPDGTEVQIQERRSELRHIPDPEDNTATIPITVSNITYRLDEQGKPFESIKRVGACKYGCVVRVQSMVGCRWCRHNICPRHAILVGNRAYCRQGWCLLIGVPHKTLWLVFRLISFCFRSVTGMNAATDSDTSVDSEEDLFSSLNSSDEADWIDEERK